MLASEQQALTCTRCSGRNRACSMPERPPKLALSEVRCHPPAKEIPAGSVLSASSEASGTGVADEWSRMDWSQRKQLGGLQHYYKNWADRGMPPPQENFANVGLRFSPARGAGGGHTTARVTYHEVTLQRESVGVSTSPVCTGQHPPVRVLGPCWACTASLRRGNRISVLPTRRSDQHCWSLQSHFSSPTEFDFLNEWIETRKG